jgi:hypothetical protein
MTKSSKTKLEYQKKYNEEHADDQVKRRRAQRHAIAKGKSKVGDGKDIDHKKPLAQGGSGDDSNTRSRSQKANRGWRKTDPKMYGANKKGKK